MRTGEANYILMPDKLTAEAGHKYALIGEFEEVIEIENPDYCGCGECDWCLSDGYDEEEIVLQEVPISWTMIKEIYRRIVSEFGER